MKRATVLLIAGAAALAGCGQSGGERNAVANAGAAKPVAPKHPTYCFFKDASTKGWAASAGKDGMVTVRGKARLDDARYRGELGQPEISGTRASVWLTMAENRGYASPDNWWDVSLKLPGSASVTDVTVLCGKRTVAELKVRR